MEREGNAGGGGQKAAAARWQEVKKVLGEALDLPSEERSAFLVWSCGDDEDLRREVESLLAEEGCLDEFLTSPLITLRAPDVPEEDPNLGRQVGPYRLVRRLGRGGMGAVYLGGRADGLFDQQVAIKLIKRGMDTEAILRRFGNERQILANLAHDHIAKLYDGGTTDDGLPYFVMEYVEGQPIDRYCDERKLPVARRLELFHTVCSAVQEAHQKLVVHRDLKPGNILVTSDGTPKLLDFGIAKLLSPDGAGAPGTAETVLGELPLTPGYASPEQLRGEPVTTASDVYSLGVLLYQLLTGRRPYDAGTLRPERWVALLAEAEAPRPSTAVGRPRQIQLAGGAAATLTPEEVAAVREGDPVRLRRKLAGDLDNIVMTAIARERGRRYATAEQLAEDVRRHLEGLPVRARTPTYRYRAGKFVRRHAVGVVAAAAAVAVLIAFAVSTEVQNRRIAAERDRAQAVTEYLVEAFRSVDPAQAQGEEVTVREAMGQGIEDIDQQLRDQPLIRATLKDAVGRVYDHLALYEQARPLLEEALAEREESLGPDDPEVAESLQHLANLLRELGKTEEAKKMLRRAVEILRRNRGEDELALARSLHNLGAFLVVQQEYEEAEARLEEALKIKQRRLAPDDPLVANTLNSLGRLHFSRQEPARAERIFRRVLEIRRAQHGPIHPEVATALNNLAVALEKQGKRAEARALYLETLELRRTLYGHEHPSVGLALYNLADLLQNEGDLEAAEGHYREALAVFRAALGEDHEQVARVRRNLATLLAERGENSDCVDQAQEAVRVFENVAPAGHWRLADARSVLGGCLAGLGRYEEAEPLLTGALEQLQAAEGKGPSAQHLADARARLAALYEAWGRSDQAALSRDRGRGAPQNGT